MKVSNWGNYPVIDAVVHSPASIEEVRSVVAASPEIIARGLGRCYGDSSLNTSILSMLRLNHLLAFDDSSGIITCESGVPFSGILDALVPRGWFLPVTPGTKHITVGGAIASDVHGKNHHVAGSFSRHLHSMKVLIGDGSIVECSKEHQTDLFWATCGGMGLTGIILEATFSLQRIQTAYMRQRVLKAKNLDAAIDAFEENKHWTYSVAWIDCLAKGESLGRSALMLGEHATVDEIGYRYRNPLVVDSPTPIPVPVFFPDFVLNPLTVKVFNELWYAKYLQRDTFVAYDPFFYPLDFMDDWNRIYGKRGFTQYQFVLPKESTRPGLRKILERIAESGEGSFLAVLKLFGKQEGLLSFPMEGFTLALDFAMSPAVMMLLKELDAMVGDYGGRLYLTKDVRMDQTMFEQGYRNVDAFRSTKRQFDAQKKFQSLQSKRIGI